MNVHVIIGSDDFLVERTAGKFLGDGTGLELVDSLNATNAELQLAEIRKAEESFSTPPFLDPVKTTWWKNVHFLPGAGGKKGPSEEVKEALEKFAGRIAEAKPVENQRLVITGPTLLKTSTFAKTLAPVAEIVYFAAEKPWEAERNAAVRVIDFAEEQGFKFAPGAAEHFVSIVGPDARSQLSELAKLKTYLGDGADLATAADVDAICSQGVGVEPQIWTLTDAIGRRQTAKALEALKLFEGENGFAVFMTTVIEKFFRQMLDFTRGGQEGLSPGNARKFPDFVRNWSERELRIARAYFLKLREQTVSGQESADELVAITLLRVMGKGRR